MADADQKNPVKPEDLQAFLRTYRPPLALQRERDMISGRYRIITNDPLNDLSTSMAKAFSAQDSENAGARLYALVFNLDAMPRKKHITALKDFRHPNLVSVIDEGTSEISIYSESRYVVILERPNGQPLSELLASTQKNPVSDGTLINYLIRPFTEILKAMSSMGISHGRINLNNVYLSGSSIQLGECISEPAGYSQDFLFESLDRLLSSPHGKNEFAIEADCYALGVLALHLLIGYQPYARVSFEDFLNSILAKGSYHTLVVEWDVSENLQDLFRALLNDAKRDRCAPEHIENWLAGRRFNLILPAVAQETNRGFEFAGRSYFNRKALAHALYMHWAEGRDLLFDTRLVRWLETSLHKKDLAEAVSRICSNNMGDTAKAEKHNNELLARIIFTLDPSGPIRYRNVSFFPEGVGAMLAHAYFSGDNDNLNAVAQVIDTDLLAQWIEQHKVGTDYTYFAPRLLKIRNFLRTRAPGFGIERCLYDLHPALICQSPLVKRFAPGSLKELLICLDTAAATAKAAETDFMDTHIAAYVASKLDIAKELRIHELDGIAELAANPRLVSIKILARAQSPAGNPSLQGLTHWIALRLFAMLDYIHRRNARSQAQHELRKAAESGAVSSIAATLLNPDVFINDFHGFKKAATAYTFRKYQIAKLKDPRERTKHARMVGRGLAQTLAYGTCVFTVYFTLRSYYHF